MSKWFVCLCARERFIHLNYQTIVWCPERSYVETKQENLKTSRIKVSLSQKKRKKHTFPLTSLFILQCFSSFFFKFCSIVQHQRLVKNIIRCTHINFCVLFKFWLLCWSHALALFSAFLHCEENKMRKLILCQVEKKNNFFLCVLSVSCLFGRKTEKGFV